MSFKPFDITYAGTTPPSPAAELKRAARLWLEAGPFAIRSRARFVGLAEGLNGDCIHACIRRVECWHWQALWRNRREPDHPSIAPLAEAKLILRWMRRNGHDHELPGVIDALTQPAPRLALIREMIH